MHIERFDLYRSRRTPPQKEWKVEISGSPERACRSRFAPAIFHLVAALLVKVTAGSIPA